MDVKTFHDAIVKLEHIDLAAYVDIIPEFKELQKCEQNPKNHAEGNVLIHSQMAMDYVLTLMGEVPDAQDQVSLYVATMLHDIGKPVTFAISPKHGGITAYGHDKQGVPIANAFLRKYFPEFHFPVRDKILSLIENHMKPRMMMKDGCKDIKLKKMSLECDIKLLRLLSIADTQGRKCDDMGNGLELLEKFKSECQRVGVWDQFYIIPNSEFVNNHAYTLARWEILTNGQKESQELLNKCQELSRQSPKFQLLLMCGVPGSGKTTYRDNIIKQFPEVKVISMDEKRKELLGDVNDQSANTMIFRVCVGELAKAMKEKRSTIWDATSASRKHRKVVIDIARRNGGLVGVIFFDLPLETILERNASREKKVPEQVVRDFYYNRIERLHVYEADKVTVIDG